MRNKYIPLFILFFLLTGKHSILVAQEGWFSINRIADGNDMSSIYFVNDSVGFTVSNEGNLFMTTNRGEDWSYNKLSASSLNDIIFIDYVGFIAGDGGKIFRSSDGVNWDEKTSGTTNKLKAVYFIDIDTGYVFGDNSTILKTIDGGETWKKLNVQSGFTITDGAFAAADFGMCTSIDGVILRTTDYGNSWQYWSKSMDDKFYSVSFLDTSTAFITGFEMDIPFMLKLLDRGNDFQIIYQWVDHASTFFVNPDTGYMVGNDGYIGKTTDGGENWIDQKSFTFKNLKGIYFLNDTLGYVCGFDSTILRTTDGGLNWSYLGSGHTLQLYDVNFPTEQVGYAVNSNGFILKTIDSGNNWNILDPEFSEYHKELNFVYFFDSDTGFTGSYNKLMRTTNGGESWVINDFESEDIRGLRSMKFYDNNIGLIAAGEKLLQTTDGGQTWNISDAPIITSEVEFIDSNNIILAGTSIYKSIDSGINWDKKFDLTGEIFYSISFSDDKTGCAVGSNGLIYRTIDGGDNWSQIPSNTTRALLKIKFVANSVFYIVGERGVILYSIDAGLSWSNQESHTLKDLNSISFVNSTTGYIVGNSGVMLKTINGGIVGVEEDNPVIPSEFYLFQNYPNPFNPSTTIEYQIPVGTRRSVFVQLKIYNSLGQEVRELVNGEQSPGRHKIVFNAGNLASGVYYYRIIADDISLVKKMTIIK